MAESSSLWHRRPAVATLVGAVLVILGFLLTSVDWRFLALSALGTFGPGILREWGWVKDKDEFQMRAVHRAGYHAYLAGGLTAFMLVGIIRSAGEAVEHAGELVTVVLAVLWFTWLLSSLYSYWGPRRTVSRGCSCCWWRPSFSISSDSTRSSVPIRWPGAAGRQWSHADGGDATEEVEGGG